MGFLCWHLVQRTILRNDQLSEHAMYGLLRADSHPDGNNHLSLTTVFGHSCQAVPVIRPKEGESVMLPKSHLQFS